MFDQPRRLEAARGETRRRRDAGKADGRGWRRRRQLGRRFRSGTCAPSTWLSSARAETALGTVDRCTCRAALPSNRNLTNAYVLSAFYSFSDSRLVCLYPDSTSPSPSASTGLPVRTTNRTKSREHCVCWIVFAAETSIRARTNRVRTIRARTNRVRTILFMTGGKGPTTIRVRTTRVRTIRFMIQIIFWTGRAEGI